MKIKEAINELKQLRDWMNGSRDLYMSIDVAKEAIDTVVAELEKHLPTDEDIENIAIDNTLHVQNWIDWVNGAKWMRNLMKGVKK